MPRNAFCSHELRQSSANDSRFTEYGNPVIENAPPSPKSSNRSGRQHDIPADGRGPWLPGVLLDERWDFPTMARGMFMHWLTKTCHDQR